MGLFSVYTEPGHSVSSMNLGSTFASPLGELDSDFLGGGPESDGHSGRNSPSSQSRPTTPNRWHSSRRHRAEGSVDGVVLTNPSLRTPIKAGDMLYCIRRPDVDVTAPVPTRHLSEYGIAPACRPASSSFILPLSPCSHPCARTLRRVETQSGNPCLLVRLYAGFSPTTMKPMHESHIIPPSLHRLQTGRQAPLPLPARRWCRKTKAAALPRQLHATPANPTTCFWGNGLLLHTSEEMWQAVPCKVKSGDHHPAVVKTS